MSYTNVDIRDRNEERRQRYMLQEEVTFWKGLANDLQQKLENIPKAVRKWGYVDLIDGNDSLRLIAEPEEPALTSPDNTEDQTHG